MAKSVVVLNFIVVNMLYNKLKNEKQQLRRLLFVFFHIVLWKVWNVIFWSSLFHYLWNSALSLSNTAGWCPKSVYRTQKSVHPNWSDDGHVKKKKVKTDNTQRGSSCSMARERDRDFQKTSICLTRCFLNLCNITVYRNVPINNDAIGSWHRNLQTCN